MSLLLPLNSIQLPHHFAKESENSSAQPHNKHLLPLIKSCKTFNHLKQIHTQLIKTGLHEQTHLLTTLISSSSSFNQLHYANLIFHQILNPNVFHWTAIIAASSRNGDSIDSLLYFKLMRESNTKPNNFTISSILSACASLNAVKEGKQVHSLYIRLGFHCDIYIDTALIHLYGKCGLTDISRQIFERMPTQNLASLNAMVFSYANCGDMVNAELLFSSMTVKDCVSYTTMIIGYGNQGDIEFACQLFDEIPEKNLGSWNSIISVLSQHGHGTEALSIFYQMLLLGFCPNHRTLASVLSICGQHGFSCIGQMVHSYVVKLGFEADGFLSSGLIDMYAKCGYKDVAKQVFSRTACKNLGTWNSMIFGLGTHGEGKAALAKVSDMEMEGVVPNEVTLLGILNACNHSGYVQEGCLHFYSMVDKYNLVPRIEHYSSLVDLLGRAGHLKQAIDVIKSMPFSPDVFTWGAFLNACRIHGDVELGRFASDRIFELDPSHAGGHILLSNLYSSSGEWDYVSKIRVEMKEKGIQNSIPGCSWIEIKEVVHKFYAMDALHPETLQIYEMLDLLHGELKVIKTLLS